MNFPNFMTIKDFFNYYVAGFLWLLEVVVIFIPFHSYQRALCFLQEYQKVADRLGAIFLGLLLVIIPYIVGFVATPLGIATTKLLRKIFGDPKEWVTDYSDKVRKMHMGRRISIKGIRLLLDRLIKYYGNQEYINQENLSKWFFQIRAIVINSKTESGKLATRDQDLANFTESILLPLPIIILTIGVKSMANSIPYGIFFLVLGVLGFASLAYRYLHLRAGWVKHIYRSFLAISGQMSDEPEEE